jgi:hypothetical protein
VTLRLLSLLPLVLTFAACGEHCDPLSSSPANAAQAAAMADARIRNAKACGLPEARCQYLVSANDTNDIWVRTNYVFVESSGQCIQAGDGVEDAVYDSTGKFLRVDPQ